MHKSGSFCRSWIQSLYFSPCFHLHTHQASVITWIKRLRAYSHRASCSVPCRGTNVPPSQNLAGLHSLCLSPNCACEHSFFIYIHHHIVTGHMHCFMSLLSIVHARLQHMREQCELNYHSTHFMAVDSFGS